MFLLFAVLAHVAFLLLFWFGIRPKASIELEHPNTPWEHQKGKLIGLLLFVNIASLADNIHTLLLELL